MKVIYGAVAVFAAGAVNANVVMTELNLEAAISKPTQFGTNPTHYGNPSGGCQSDEQAIQVQGLAGDFCSPSCTLGSCPTDLPKGANAVPQCALQTSFGEKYCALICSPSQEGMCGAGTCKATQGVGLCTYDDVNDSEVEQSFTEFMRKYNKQYTTEELPARLAAFKDNLAYIAAHDSEATYTLAVNEFADMSWDEFSAMYKGYTHRSQGYRNSLNAHESAGIEVADAVDWRTKDVVTPVKDQGQCGSCWAFSTTGSVEGATALASGDLVSLSEQQLVDCAGKNGNQGCNGGLMDDAFEYIIQNGGVGLEADYPYKGKKQFCKKNTDSAVTISGFKDVRQGDEDDLMSAVNVGPVSIAIEADQRGFQLYNGGVFDGACGEQLDHGVLIVGYGTDDGKDYWTVKNSWGGSWGESGYIRLVRGQNQCGLADSASYPTV